jgi:hypothetical protein
MKNTNEQSPRCPVEKWLPPAPATPVHVTAFSRTRLDGRRYVCVEMSSPSGAHALFFFKHDDGSWCVFPQCQQTEFDRRASSYAGDCRHLLTTVPSLQSSIAPLAIQRGTRAGVQQLRRIFVG